MHIRYNDPRIRSGKIKVCGLETAVKHLKPDTSDLLYRMCPKIVKLS